MMLSDQDPSPMTSQMLTWINLVTGEPEMEKVCIFWYLSRLNLPFLFGIMKLELLQLKSDCWFDVNPFKPAVLRPNLCSMKIL